jgi:hypothetical protein
MVRQKIGAGLTGDAALEQRQSTYTRAPTKPSTIARSRFATRQFLTAHALDQIAASQSGSSQ